MNIYQPCEYSTERLFAFLKETDGYFIPALSERVNLHEWAEKICKYAVVFEVEQDGLIVGIGATYFNKAPAVSYGTYVCVKKEYQKEMFGVELIQRMIDYAEENGSGGYKCEIRESNKPLVKFYRALGFETIEENASPNSDGNRLIIQKLFNEKNRS